MNLQNSTFLSRKVRDVEIFAYVRFADESITFQESLNSLLPAINKGVLVYHLLPDTAPEQTKRGHACCIEIAQEFCSRNPGFELICYPHEVVHQNHETYFRDRVCRQRAKQGLPPLPGFDQELAFENTLQAFYEFTRDQVLARAQTSLPYILKVDGDHIYDSKVIQQQISFLETAPELIRFFGLPKFNVYYSPTRDKLYFKNVVAVNDHFIMLANLMKFSSYCDDKYDINGKQIAENCEAWEVIDFVHPQKALIVEQSWLRKLLNKIRGKSSYKFRLTHEYLSYFLREHGAALKTIFGTQEAHPAILFYQFTPQQCRLAYSDNCTELFFSEQANGLPLEIQNCYPAVCTLKDRVQVDTIQLKTLLEKQYSKLKLESKNSSQASVPAPDCYNGTIIDCRNNLIWFNSAHFLSQKYAVKENPITGDYSEERLQEMNFVPFKQFLNSSLFQEISIRYPFFDANSLLFNEDKLLEKARKLDYSLIKNQDISE